jgi:hypothetical protein
MNLVPAGAQISDDGFYWWDGTQWQLIASPASQRSFRMSSVTLWFNVFIADHKVEALATCFLGDDRDFDSSAGASSRVHAGVTVSGLGTAGAVMARTDVHCGLTRMIDCKTEEVKESATANPSGGFDSFHCGNTFPDPVAGVQDTANEFVATLALDVKAADPLVELAPTVGADLFITIDPAAGTVALKGAIDWWPSFEGYASADGGSVVNLFQISPPPGSDPFTLLQPRNRPVDVTVQVA